MNKSVQVLRHRKLLKLRKNPLLFIRDSFAFNRARDGVIFAWGRVGSFSVILLMLIALVLYYSFMASSRYTSEMQFVVRDAGADKKTYLGLVGSGNSPGVKDALILKAFLHSREMAVSLNEALALKEHYESQEWDLISRLSSSSSIEDYVAFFKNHLIVLHDQESGIIKVEVQSFNPEYSLQLALEILRVSELFINGLGAEMLDKQLAFAEEEIQRSHESLIKSKGDMIEFQNRYQLYNPEQQGGALVAIINKIESDIITEKAELKSLLAFMRDGSSEVSVKRVRIAALEEQLKQEKKRLTSSDEGALNSLNEVFQELKLNSKLASDLYLSSLSGLEGIRLNAYQNIKHLLIIESPALAEDEKYPRRIYSILTWIVMLLLAYFVGHMILSIIKEHRE